MTLPDNREGEHLLRQLTQPEQLNTLSLVLSSANLPHRVVISERHFFLYIQQQYLEAAEYQLQAYQKEAKNWPPPPTKDPIGDFSPHFKWMASMVVFILMTFYSKSGPWQSQSNWFSQGCGDADKILQQGEWYRLTTALTLHADANHLLGNCLFAAILLHFFFGITGNGIGLFALLATGTLANLLNVIAHGNTHLFVGFSTAIFSAVGMLCTINFAQKPKTGESKKRKIMRILMPLMAGLALLALLGSGGERTDLGSHLFGLLVGLITGNCIRLPGFDDWRSSFWLQCSFGVLTFLAVATSWYLAGRSFF